MSGFRTWQPGEVITANNVQSYLQDQVVMVFPSSAVRATAVVVPTEGMLSWVEDNNVYQYYNGSAWVNLITPVTGGTAGQAYVAQGGTAAAAFGDVKAEFIALTLQAKSANYTVQASDTNTVLNLTTAATVTVPDVLSDIGDRVDILMNATSGTTTIVAGTGITSWAGAGTAGTSVAFRMPIPYTAASVIKTASQTYRVIGRVFA